MDDSLTYLQHYTDRGERWAFGELGYLMMRDECDENECHKGKVILWGTASSADRKSACRVATFFQLGKYEFEHDCKRASMWREKASRWLESDALLNYNNSTYKGLSISRLEKWQKHQVRIWHKSHLQYGECGLG